MSYGAIVSASQSVTLTMNDIDAYDPYGVGRSRRLCPLCGSDKPRDDAHRSMWINSAHTGFKCHRCGEHGRIGDRGTWLPTDEFKAKMQARRDEEWRDDLAKM